MTNTIKCQNCGAEIEITQALKHQIEEQVLASERLIHKQELEKLKKDTEERIRQKVAEEMEMRIKDAENEKKELRTQNKIQQEQLLELNRLMRELKNKDEQRQLEMEKKLLAASDKIKEEIGKQYTQEYRLKELEKDKKIADMEKLVEELKRKAQQGSMQSQGEVMELDLEFILKNSFPEDEVAAVGKGVTGADIRQMVKSPRGVLCGVILWECKRTKAWSDEWLTKLKSDLRAERANVPIIVSQTLPKEAKNGMGIKEGVWVTNYSLILPLALLIRNNLLDVTRQKVIAANRGEKSQMLYSFITSHEFIQQVEALVEVYREMQNQITRERMVFEKNWKQRDAQIRRLFISTAGMFGSIQGIVGSSMPQVKGFDLLELEDGKGE